MLPPSRYFPPAESADAQGLVAVGGQLTPEWLVDAYRHGIFPWPITGRRTILAWFSPDPRAIFELDGFHVSRRLCRTLRSGRFSVTCDRDFAGVIRGCAYGPGRVGQTWITPEIIQAYERIQRLGIAHSVEVWVAGRLVGGTYGVAMGGLFAAESMFHLETDASKVALAHLVTHLRRRNYLLFDIQQLTPHTATLGAIEISRRAYLERLEVALASESTFGDFSSQEEAW
jgi:leucyl/phenylalanyl-tRNA---protein transferase